MEFRDMSQNKCCGIPWNFAEFHVFHHKFRLPPEVKKLFLWRPYASRGSRVMCFIDPDPKPLYEYWVLIRVQRFYNLVMQTLWWLHNYILRYIHKKRFSVFLSRFLRICSQSSKKVLIWPKKFFFFTKSKKVSKNAEFHADFESVEKVLKKCIKKKLLAKTWRKNAHFSLLFMFVKLVLLITFFWCIFSQLFQRIWNQREVLRFLTPFWILKKKNFFGHISTFFKLWSQMRKKRLKKSKNVFS